ncbi:uncharacterized protein L3040_005308 [Drepanopeziza brunnea f. sp. 'multigermtubi']|uniref:uncharacterized protein n=1 Tax=Drepanopeziza brunnea f. sp. 'multigermtubi' TaxID=698441 RepID=UPI002387C1DA|nr:hypothetical protein L3040_005308 [Drepanopeziza brunnea f. sp. 'multigermtubi']
MQAIYINLLNFLLILTFSPTLTLGSVDNFNTAAAQYFESKGLTISPPRFLGEFLGLPGVQINNTGSLDEIIAQVKLDHPEWKPSTDLEQHGAPRNIDHLRSRASTSQMFAQQYTCYPTFASARTFSELVPFARNQLTLAGTNIVYMDAHSCGRLARFGDAGIWICYLGDRDNWGSPSLYYIGTCVDYIAQQCLQDWDPRIGTGYVSGQLVDSDQWSVAVFKDG